MSMDELGEDQLQMRGFIEITEQLLCAYARVTRPETMLVESVLEESVETTEHPIVSEARDLVFKLRAFMEDSSGEYALGVENGMQRAADMIENLIRRHEKGDGLG
jgi:hypothetical protein